MRNQESRTNGVTVSTRDNAPVGDTLIVKGTVRTGKNSGLGYAFCVIIENATPTKQ